MTATDHPITDVSSLVMFEDIKARVLEADKLVDVEPVVKAAEAYMLHAQFEDERPEVRAYAEMLEAQRVAAYGGGEGYAPAREFPCPGVLRVENPGARLQFVSCDACGYETSLRAAKREAETGSGDEEMAF